eukprot:4319811-Amphidinium_carterae.1
MAREPLIMSLMESVVHSECATHSFDHHRENTSDHQYHSGQKKNKKFQEHRYTPKYWKIRQNGCLPM